MTGEVSTCGRPACTAGADFRLYDGDAAEWVPVCERHALAVHPSLEIHALLESGYLRPAELGDREGPPAEPSTGRARAFREVVEELTGWSA